MRTARLICYALLAAPLLCAQADTARITGTVGDGSGAVIPGASVTVKNERTGSERAVKADEQEIGRASCRERV